MKDLGWKVSERAHVHRILSLFEWVVEVPGPVDFLLSLLHRGGSAQVYVRVICSTT